MERTATYKGRTYRLLWSGKTRYGHRTKLGFMDGSKEFWADSSRVTEGGRGGRGGGEKCAECYERPGVVMCSDASGLQALCCRRCASYSQYERSFA